MHDTEPRKADNALARAFTLASLLRFAFPTMLMMVFNGLYTIVDVIFVARFVNADALSSINIVTPAMGLLWGLEPCSAPEAARLSPAKWRQRQQRRAT